MLWDSLDRLRSFKISLDLLDGLGSSEIFLGRFRSFEIFWDLLNCLGNL